MTQERLVPGRIDLTVGDVEGAEEYLFGSIRGLEFDAGGRIFVADGDAGEVRVFDAKGGHLFTIGGSGGGPGEFLQFPCNLTLDPEGRLWVADGELRWHRYSVDRRGAVFEGTVGLPDGYRGWCEPLSFPRDGEFITEVVRGGQQGAEAEHVLARVDLVGRILQAWPVRVGRALEDFGWTSVTFSRDRGADVTILFPPPFPRRPLWARARSGGYAHVETHRFRVEVYETDGELITVIEQPVAPPRLTTEERRRAEATLDSLRAQFIPLGGYPDFMVPDTKPPVQGLWFDADGRLWVMINTVGIGGDNRAQVFSDAGIYLFTATWPDRVSLGHGAIRGDTAIGVQLGAFDIQRVVRIRFDTP